MQLPSHPFLLRNLQLKHQRSADRLQPAAKHHVGPSQRHRHQRSQGNLRGELPSGKDSHPGKPAEAIQQRYEEQ